jgi:hypothetical protein
MEGTIMKHPILMAMVAGSLLFGAATFAETDAKPPMHMHKSEMDHRSDKEVATQYKDEATQLREKAESHRKLAKLYRGRTPAKGAANYANVVAHCEQLAQFYDNAAKEAEGVAAELSK